MNFSCEREIFFKAIQIVEKAVSFKSTLPIIGNILLETTKDGLKLYSNDLEIGIEVTILAKISNPGLILIPAKTLSGIISKLPNKEIIFKVSDRAKMEIICGSSRFNLNTLPPDDFPPLPIVKKEKTFQLAGDRFREMIENVILAVSQDESKQVLNGVLMEIENKEINMVATDGYRLAKYTEKMKTAYSGKISIILPAKALTQLLYILGQTPKDQAEKQVEVSVSLDQISFKYENVYFVSRLIQGQFPNYRQVIPKDFKVELTGKRREILEAFERSAVIAASSANIVKIKISENKLYISANTPDLGNSNEWLDLKVKGDAKIQVAFNVKLVIDVLKTLDCEEVSFGFNGALNPGMIQPKNDNDYIYIVMPIRTVDSQESE